MKVKKPRPMIHTTPSASPKIISHKMTKTSGGGKHSSGLLTGTRGKR